MSLELYVADEDVARLAALPRDHPEPLVALAWHLRQRETRRALALADQAESLIGSSEAGGCRGLAARLALIRAEAACLFGELDRAAALLATAAAGFDTEGDRIGRGDVHLVEALLALCHGQSQRELAAYQAAAAEYAGDALRSALADCLVAYAACWLDIGRAAEFHEPLLAAAADPDPAVSALALMALNRVAMSRGDFARAIEQAMGAFDRARQVGLIRLSILAASLVATGFANLEDFDDAVLWYERALEIARPTGWPMAIAVPLTSLAKLCEMLGQAQNGIPLLDEAMRWLAPFPASRNTAIALRYRGDIALALGRNEEALAAFEALEAQTRALGHGDLGFSALRGRAQALARLQRFGEAHQVALGALAGADAAGDTAKVIDILFALGEIHEQGQLPAPPEATSPNAALHYLERAIAIAGGLAGAHDRVELLVPLARAWEAEGDLRRALDYERRARAALLRDQAENSAKRILALQVRAETERARAEAEHQRRRAEAAAETSRTLDQLGRIGQQITANLDSAGLFERIAAHVGALIDTQSLSVYLLDDTGETLIEAFGIEDGQTREGHVVALDDLAAGTARAVRERAEILLNLPADPAAVAIVPGTRLMGTALFAPLIVGDRVLGVLTVQAERENAYGERECLIFRTICAYSAIALDNARVYRSLDRANTELERLANIDPLTGLANRRRFFRAAAEELALARRHGLPCAVVMIDIDHFKRVNDTYGHAAGDAVLRGAASCLAHCLRDSDLGARFGGEELAALLPGSTMAGAVHFAERFRHCLETTETAHEGMRIRVTASLGVAEWSAPEDDIEAAIARADRALYRAKHAGRNAVAEEAC